MLLDESGPSCIMIFFLHVWNSFRCHVHRWEAGDRIGFPSGLFPFFQQLLSVVQKNKTWPEINLKIFCIQSWKLLKQACSHNMTFKRSTEIILLFHEWRRPYLTFFEELVEFVKKKKTLWQWGQIYTGQADCLTCVSHQPAVVIIWSSAHTTTIL